MLANNVIASSRTIIAPRRGIGPFLRIAGGWISRAWRNHQTRRYLAEMDARTLADLGISRAQAQFEASRWAWDWAPLQMPSRNAENVLNSRTNRDNIPGYRRGL